MDEKTKEIVERLRNVSGMITLGERIPWGTDTALMDQAASLIESLSERVGELETKLLNSGCPNCNPSKLHAILGDPTQGVSLNNLAPSKQGVAVTSDQFQFLADKEG